MAGKHSLAILGFSMEIIVKKYLHVIMAWSLFMNDNSNLAEEIVLGYITKMSFSSDGV